MCKILNQGGEENNKVIIHVTLPWISYEVLPYCLSYSDIIFSTVQEMDFLNESYFKDILFKVIYSFHMPLLAVLS